MWVGWMVKGVGRMEGERCGYNGGKRFRYVVEGKGCE